MTDLERTILDLDSWCERQGDNCPAVCKKALEHLTEYKYSYRGMSRYLYTVYRNKDDKLMLTDATAQECCEKLKVRMNTFYAYQCESHINRSKKYTIIKIRRREAERE